MAIVDKDKDNQALLQELTRGFEDLKLSFDLYFQGLERKPPTDKRTELTAKLRKAKETQTRNTAFKFRINQMWASFQTYATKWDRILKEIEEGTYKRDKFKVKLRNQEEAQQSRGEDDLDVFAEPREKKQEAFEIEDLDFDVEEGDDGHIPAVAVSKSKPAPAAVFPTGPAPAGASARAATPFGNIPVSSSGMPRPANPFPAPMGANGPVQRPAAAAGANPAAPGAPRPVAAGANPAAPGAPRTSSFGAMPAVGANPAAPGAPRPVAAGANPAAPGAPRVPPPPAPPPRPAPPPVPGAPRPTAAAMPAAPGAPARTASNGGTMPAAPRPIPPGTPGGPPAQPRPVAPGAPGAAAARPVVQPAGVAAGPRPTNGAGIPAAAARPAAPAGSGVSDDMVRRVHSELTEANRRLGNNAPGTSFESLKATLNKQAPAIKQQHNARDVEFKVEVKDDKAVLKAIPKK